MSEQQALLQAIIDNPEDDAVRLVYADWLEERDDPLAELIRLQLALEPLRIPCTDPLAELVRVKRSRRIPPGKDFPDDNWPVARQLQREYDLLRDYKDLWLGEAARLSGDDHNHFDPEFRRGFVESAEIGLTCLEEHGEELRRSCPTLRKLIVFGTLGRGKELASCAGLAGIPELVLAGWLRGKDATVLLASPHLAGVRSLTVWIGPGQDERTCEALAHLPALRELTLVQMWGGIEAAEPERLDEQADELAAFVRQRNAKCRVVVQRPFARLFPLDGLHIGYGIDAGHVPSGQAVLIDEGREPVVMYFDDEGRLQREERLDLSEKLVRQPEYSGESCNVEELIEVLGDEIGFTPGPIFVREFSSELADVGISCWDQQIDEVAYPETTDAEEGEEIGASLYWWYSTGQFLLPFDNFYWADGLGRVHSS